MCLHAHIGLLGVVLFPSQFFLSILAVCPLSCEESYSWWPVIGHASFMANKTESQVWHPLDGYLSGHVYSTLLRTFLGSSCPVFPSCSHGSVVGGDSHSGCSGKGHYLHKPQWVSPPCSVGSNNIAMILILATWLQDPQCMFNMHWGSWSQVTCIGDLEVRWPESGS